MIFYGQFIIPIKIAINFLAELPLKLTELIASPTDLSKKLSIVYHTKLML